MQSWTSQAKLKFEVPLFVRKHFLLQRLIDIVFFCPRFYQSFLSYFTLIESNTFIDFWLFDVIECALKLLASLSGNISTMSLVSTGGLTNSRNWENWLFHIYISVIANSTVFGHLEHGNVNSKTVEEENIVVNSY